MLALQDRGFEALEHWMGRVPDAIYFSDFGWGEFVSAVGRRVRATGQPGATGDALLDAARLYTVGWRIEPIQTSDILDATEMLRDFNLSLRLPDAIHIAVARRLDCTLISTDRPQGRAASANGVVATNPLYT
jgi:predicted nucleic acid-binding protein